MRHVLCDEEVAAVAGRCHGFVGADLKALAAEAALCALRRAVAGEGQVSLTLDDVRCVVGEVHMCVRCSADAHRRVVHAPYFLLLRRAEAVVRPSALREVAVEVPAASWADVGGLESVKQQLQEVVTWPQRHAAALARLGVDPPRGVLLHGPPGCSKTLLARAVAGECGLNFLAVKGPALLSKYVGESERAVTALFARCGGYWVMP